jgi:cytochrome oxidase assembly protein ShyY1
MFTKENRRFSFDWFDLSFSLRIFLVVVKRAEIKKNRSSFFIKKGFFEMYQT